VTEEIDGRVRFVQALELAESVLSREKLIQRLDETVIALVVGREQATDLATQTTALTAVNLLVRLFRRLVIVVPNNVRIHKELPCVEGRLGAALVTFASRVHPGVEADLAVSPPPGIVTLRVSNYHSWAEKNSEVYCSGAGWLAHVGSRPRLLPAAQDSNPIGPLIAACLGVAEVFKIVFGDVLRSVVPADDVIFSALTYRVGELDVGPILSRVRLPNTVQVGAGSIGCAFNWGLAHLREIRGKLVVVDHDKLQAHNPDRAILVLDDAASLELEKSSWARDIVQPWVPHLDIQPFQGTIRQYVDTLPPDYTFPVIISAVDSIESRRDIQDALPEHILNASTGPTKVELSRHEAPGDGPCLYCLYLPEILERAPILLAVARTGFNQRTVADFLVGARMLNVENVRGIERRNQLPPGALGEYIGRPLSDLLQDQRWYSQAPIQLHNAQALVTTAFVSALAGFLLLAETVKQADPALAHYRLHRIYEQDLLGVPNEFILPGERDGMGYCLCHDPLRRRLYAEKYGRNVHSGAPIAGEPSHHGADHA
jgi:hypothetical protein